MICFTEIDIVGNSLNVFTVDTLDNGESVETLNEFDIEFLFRDAEVRRTLDRIAFCARTIGPCNVIESITPRAERLLKSLGIELGE